jgi:hypothetical protein
MQPAVARLHSTQEPAYPERMLDHTLSDVCTSRVSMKAAAPCCKGDERTGNWVWLQLFVLLVTVLGTHACLLFSALLRRSTRHQATYVARI